MVCQVHMKTKPRDLCSLFFCLQKSLILNYLPVCDSSIGTIAVEFLFCCSGFIFLRLVCLAILNPKQFNLITGDSISGFFLSLYYKFIIILIWFLTIVFGI